MTTVKELAINTSDAPTYHKFKSWIGCIKSLHDFGFNNSDVKKILYLEWMERAFNYSRKCTATNKDLERYVDNHLDEIKIFLHPESFVNPSQSTTSNRNSPSNEVLSNLQENERNNQIRYSLSEVDPCNCISCRRLRGEI